MKTRLCLFMLLITVASPTYAQGQKKPRTIADYQPRTLRELSAMLPENFRAALAERGDEANKDLRVIVHGELFPSRVKVVFSGTKRPLVDIKRHVITGWANKFAGNPEFYTVPYQTELLFTEGAEQYWLAVHNDLLAQEWKQGETLELCVIKLGNARVVDQLEAVLLVEKVIGQ